jgi:hypothetical protein
MFSLGFSNSVADQDAEDAAMASLDEDKIAIVNSPLPEYNLVNPTDGEPVYDICLLSSKLTTHEGRISLDGTCRYLASCSTLSPYGVAVHKLLLVLICLACKSCFLPKDMPGHLKHGHDIKVVDKDAFARACLRWHLHLKHSDILYPSPRGPPVEVIPTLNGFACAVDPAGCAFACCSKDWMEKHVRKDHPDRPALLTSCYRSGVKVQILFPTFMKKYVEVEPALWNVPKDDVLVHVLQDFLPTIPGPSVNPPDSDRERDALLRLTQWDVIMQPYYTDPAKCASIHALKASPRQADPAFHRLHTAMQDYIQRGLYIGRTVSPNLTVRKHLVQGRTLSSVPL